MQNKPNQTQSEFIPKGAEIPTGELLGILKPGTNFRGKKMLLRVFCSLLKCFQFCLQAR